jgi:hypothetical protein
MKTVKYNHMNYDGADEYVTYGYELALNLQTMQDTITALFEILDGVVKAMNDLTTHIALLEEGVLILGSYETKDSV